jgi:hypothetical protein
MKHLLVPLIVAMLPLAAHADSIVFSPVTAASGNIDLNLGTAAWAYYSDGAVGDYNYAGSNSPTTDAANLASFTPFVDTIGGYPTEAHNGGFSVTYAGGAGGNNGVANIGDTGFLYANPGSGPDGFSISSTLFAPVETFNFYLINYNTGSDITASLNDSGSTSSSLTNVLLSGDGSGGTSGLLSLTVNGSIGDVLTFVDNAHTIGGAANTGIIAADVVPEPSTWLMFAAAAGVLLVYARSRKTASA